MGERGSKGAVKAGFLMVMALGSLGLTGCGCLPGMMPGNLLPGAPPVAGGAGAIGTRAAQAPESSPAPGAVPGAPRIARAATPWAPGGSAAAWDGIVRADTARLVGQRDRLAEGLSDPDLDGGTRDTIRGEVEALDREIALARTRGTAF